MLVGDEQCQEIQPRFASDNAGIMATIGFE
jgi:hypothetical protein